MERRKLKKELIENVQVQTNSLAKNHLCTVIYGVLGKGNHTKITTYPNQPSMDFKFFPFSFFPWSYFLN